MTFAAITLKGVRSLKSRAARSWTFSFSSVRRCLISVLNFTSSVSASLSLLERVCECSSSSSNARIFVSMAEPLATNGLMMV